MEILLWLVPAVVATCVAMGIAAWVGRDQPADAAETPALLPGEVVGRPGEGVSAARPVRTASADAEPRRTAGRAPQETPQQVPQQVPQRPPAPGVRRTA